MEEPILRRTWAEIDLDALAHNYQQARRKIGPNVKYLGVVKADAYGHGAIQVSRKLEQLGADYLAVSSLDEAKELRRAGIQAPILILGHTPREQVGQLIDLHITQAVSCQAKALEYSEEAVRCGGELTVHIKVDTGMSRLGYLVSGRHFDTGTADICAACALPIRKNNWRCSAGSSTRWKQSAASGSPYATAPTPAAWRRTRRHIWTWCVPAFCCTAAATWRRSWGCTR